MSMRRSLSAFNQVARRGLEEFFDAAYKKGERRTFGRAWTAEELRRKSFEDLQKLWYLLQKEQNVVLTEREAGIEEGSFRMKFVKQSMARIKTVLAERKKEFVQSKSEELRSNELSEKPSM